MAGGVLERVAARMKKKSAKIAVDKSATTRLSIASKRRHKSRDAVYIMTARKSTTVLISPVKGGPKVPKSRTDSSSARFSFNPLLTTAGPVRNMLVTCVSKSFEFIKANQLSSTVKVLL